MTFCDSKIQTVCFQRFIKPETPTVLAKNKADTANRRQAFLLRSGLKARLDPVRRSAKGSARIVGGEVG